MEDFIYLTIVDKCLYSERLISGLTKEGWELEGSIPLQNIWKKDSEIRLYFKRQGFIDRAAITKEIDK